MLQGAEAVLVAAAEQLGPTMLQTLPAAWQHMAGPLLPPGIKPNQLAAAPPAGDAQVCCLSGLSVLLIPFVPFGAEERRLIAFYCIAIIKTRG